MNTVGTYTNPAQEDKKSDTWNDVHKKLLASHFVSCVDNYELNQFITDFKNIYKGTHTAQQIADAVMACCKKRDKKISSEFFLLFVLTKLG